MTCYSSFSVKDLVTTANTYWGSLPQEVKDLYENGDVVFFTDGMKVYDKIVDISQVLNIGESGEVFVTALVEEKEHSACNLKRVEVTWLDSCGWSGWHEKDEVIALNESLESTSIGYVIRDLEDRLVLAQSESLHYYGEVLSIPKVAITKVVEL
jgi:hypothetical protein